MKAAGPVNTDIVLLGGGHAHVHVLSAFAMRPEPGVRLTLVTRDLATPYSGMLPGVIAGLYTKNEVHIDLLRLTTATGARLIHAEGCGIDRIHKRLLLAGRAPLAYDLLSIDVGITPALSAIAGAAEHAIAVKPIGLFLAKLDELLRACRELDGPRRVAVIGGGAGGVELLLSLRTRLRQEAKAAGRDPAQLSFVLVTDEKILAQHNTRVAAALRRVLIERGVDLHEDERVVRIAPGLIEIGDGRKIAADAILVATDAAPPAWFAQTGLARDDKGFLAVSPALQVLNDPDVFAAGDCAALIETPRAKAGVFAVRAGPPLAANLRRHTRGQALRSWHPQAQHLALISTGDRYAVASRGGFKAEGAWLWTLKNWIDRRWMRMYQDADAMAARMPKADAAATSVDATEVMRCGGCAAKVGPGPLSRALARLAPQPADALVIGLDAPDDAAVIAPPVGKHLVQTVDFFRAFIDDPYLFGEIAANHALNDIFAMGGAPRFSLAMAVIPYGAPAKVEEELFQVLAGARACFDREGVALAGGHSGQGDELAVGFTVTGEIAPDKVIRKGGLKAGDALVLVKPLGTAILFAAAMRAKAKASMIEAALAGMRQSNRVAVDILAIHGATAMTDVTGFGLAGHLGEMLAASGACAEIDLATLPLYDGVLALAREGIASTSLPENLALLNLLEGSSDMATRAILFDPQTAGGILAGIPRDKARACVEALRKANYMQAHVIGEVVQDGLNARDVKIRLRGALEG